MFVCACLIAIGFSWRDFDARRYAPWLVGSVGAQITQSDIDLVERTKRGGVVLAPTWRFAATYNVAGKPYRTTLFDPEYEQTYEDATNAQRRYPNGVPIKLQHLNSNPADAWAYLSLPYGRMLFTTFFAIFGLFSFPPTGDVFQGWQRRLMERAAKINVW